MSGMEGKMGRHNSSRSTGSRDLRATCNMQTSYVPTDPPVVIEAIEAVREPEAESAEHTWFFRFSRQQWRVEIGLHSD